jgi:hypothetical protein
VIHWNKYEETERARVLQVIEELRPYLRPIVEDAGVSLFEVLGWPVAAEPPPISESGPAGAGGEPPRQ